MPAQAGSGPLLCSSGPSPRPCQSLPGGLRAGELSAGGRFRSAGPLPPLAVSSSPPRSPRARSARA
eukprot:8882835-Alexandrium_andersonii.AAC.1